MRYIDKAPYINGKKFIDGKSDYVIAPDDVIKQSLAYMKISPAYIMAMKYTESDEEFYRAAKDLTEFIPKEYQTDVFYTIKNGYALSGVPAKLVTLLEKAKSMYDYPNVALSMIKWEELTPFLKEGVIKDSTLCDVVSNIWKSNVKILSSYRKRAEYSATVEIYVEKDANGDLFDTVCIIPKDISSMIVDKDVSNIVYDVAKGLLLNGSALRQYNGRYGVTTSDIDLSGAF